MTMLKARCFLLCAALLGAGAAVAQSWPPESVRIIVPYPPGSEPDVISRELGTTLGQQTGKTFIVDNRPGANSIIGTTELVNAGGDGNVLMVVDRLAVVTNPALYSKLPYKWEDALKPVSDLSRVDLFIAVRDGFPAKNYAELLKYAKDHPGKVNVGTGGIGHVNHIGMAMVAQAHGLNFTYVPYKGVVPALQAVLTGEVDVVMAGGFVLKPQHEAKRIRVLVTGAEKRSAVLPDVPTPAEAGGVAGSIPSTVFAMFAPAKVPDAVVSQVNAAVLKAVGEPATKASFASRGMDVAPTAPRQTLELMKKESASYDRTIRGAGIKID